MIHIKKTLTGMDGTAASLTGYIIDNSPEIDMGRRRPAILIFPGGGYEMTSDREAEPIALRMVGAGFHAFVLRYSVSPSPYPTALLEAAEAMSLIRSHAQEWNIDPNMVMVAGFSAGGHLAASLSTSSGDRPMREHGLDPAEIRPNGLMIGYPVITSGPSAHRGSIDHLLGDMKEDPRLLDEVSVERHVDSTTPPVFIWHTVTDDCVPVDNTMLFIRSCLAAGVSVEAHLFPHGGHGLSLGTRETAWQGIHGIEPCVQPWPDLFASWVRRISAESPASKI